METATKFVHEAAHLYIRAGLGGDPNERPASYKTIGIVLAICSGLFIGVSFIFSKKGLLAANEKYSEVAGEGYGYLKNAWWWGGMSLMVVGEICNFVAYAFTDAILVASLGALSVVISTVLSAIFLKERLSAVGIVGCFLCILGSVVIALNIPATSAVQNIDEMRDYVLKPGILVYGGLVILGSLFLAFWVGPRYGSKNVMVYLGICSLVGGLSVVATQGLGATIVAEIGGTANGQFKEWFLYVLLAFVVVTLIVEILYLNKALNIFNAALVTPTYYVSFTSATIITSAVLFRGFKGTASQIITVIMGFLTICSGVVLLQLSKSAKDVPDAAVFSGDLNQLRTIAEQEQPESDPKADAIRGTASIVRRMSHARRDMELRELRRLHEEAHMQPLGEDGPVEYEWDGLRRRRTTLGSGHGRPFTPRMPQRTPTFHPPLGMSHFPEEEDGDNLDRRPSSARVESGQSGFAGGFLGSLRTRARSMVPGGNGPQSPMHPLPLTEIAVPGYDARQTLDPNSPYYNTAYSPTHHSKLGEQKTAYDSPNDPTGAHGEHSHLRDTFGNFSGLGGLASSVAGGAGRHAQSATHLDSSTPRPGHGAKRQFSFTNVFRRSHQHADEESEIPLPDPGFHKARIGMGSRGTSASGHVKGATEEERAGLVKGDSASDVTGKFPLYEEEDVYSPPMPTIPARPAQLLDSRGHTREASRGHSREQSRDASPTKRGKGTIVEREEYEAMRRKWGQKDGTESPPPPPTKDGKRGGDPPAFI